ncbi:Phosphoglucomutase, first 3 domain-containing protein [Rozella allomycis CSF55]|uniref:Alpha-D-phosphohexomutase, alpha/beta/alpha II domain-containing protein n=1 Tax=Rozella allomycis (strain CSF55) TaxID=988480 RepID=A0A075AQ30_ROZAC|nr:Alpha-D-phosphohexomutase, alpha/beta/alpha II domain-containing protein [Rozella allomycis CSF55]RKP21036.1 Phosphoglucomutase, first 3 domain-containing protein [Rozella allomycis CSF55]|eukprot:EPZ32308.1 Alpha-D-phosphohexomutase, alpha/beta/alpha II domain-containing protein [Rozella allomycis CSF55]
MSLGLCAHLIKTRENITSEGVVIGHDHRHHSWDFARLATAVFLKNNVKVYLLQAICPTPFVPFSVTFLKAACGIMITASHNPKEDNGYKVYWNNGCQIVSPTDKDIAKSIISNFEPETWDYEAYTKSSICVDPMEQIAKEYFSRLSKYRFIESYPQLPIVYTAMHGVGYEYILKALKAIKYPYLIPVKEQVLPDPDFPTVKYPNPEEGKGSLKLAIETAESHNSSIILANDPDADRLAIAAKDKNSNWQTLSGNQIGILLAYYCVEKLRNRERISPGQIAMVTTIVSSKMLKAFCLKNEHRYEETLTGFKYIGNEVLKLESEGYRVPFAYEEAIGFMVFDLVRDKDGISALSTALQMLCELHFAGLSVFDKLDKIYEELGYFASSNGYLIVKDRSRKTQIFDFLSKKQEYLGEYKIKKIINYSPSLMIYFELENGWIVFRTSGTEPKVKYYSEMVGNLKDRMSIESKLHYFTDGLVNELNKL